MTTNVNGSATLRADIATKRGYNMFLLLVAGLGGLLYGIDVGIIGGALPYLEATSHLTAAELSVIVAAVLLGSVFSTLFAGLLADWMGRKPLMIISGLAFMVSIPVIALSQGYCAAFFRTALAGHERRVHRRRGSAVSCRVPVGVESRQGHRNFPMAAHIGHCGRGAHRHLLQLPC